MKVFASICPILPFLLTVVVHGKLFSPKKDNITTGKYQIIEGELTTDSNETNNDIGKPCDHSMKCSEGLKCLSVSGSKKACILPLETDDVDHDDTHKQMRKYYSDHQMQQAPYLPLYIGLESENGQGEILAKKSKKSKNNKKSKKCKKGKKCTTRLKCPKFSKQVGGINANIFGCGLEQCGNRYNKKTIEECRDHCWQNRRCRSFTWAPSGTVCTIYDSDEPDGISHSNQIMCKPVF